MSIVTKFERFATAHIKREGLSELLDALRGGDFYTAPASTRYHHSYEGGLAEHSLDVAEILMDDLVGLNVASKESIAIVGLFHDICKMGFYKKEMRNTKDEKGKWIQVPYYTVDDQLPLGHSEKSIIMLREYIKLSADEILAINAHMGGFDSRPNVISNTFNICPLALHLHIADLKSTYLK